MSRDRLAPVIAATPGARSARAGMRLVSALTVLALAACRAAPAAEATRVPAASAVPPTPTATVPLYFGRFVANVPAGVRPAGDANTTIEEIVIQDVVRWRRSLTDSLPANAASAWQVRIDSLERHRSLRPDTAAATVLVQRRLAPNVWVLFRYGGPAIPTARIAEALVDFGTFGIWLSVDYRAGYEAGVLRGVERVARGYRTFDPGAERPVDGPAFHLAHGAFLLPFGFQEGTTLYVDAGVADFRRFEITTASGEDPEWGPGLIAEWRAKLSSPEFVAAYGGGRLLRARPRVVAGLAGEEIVAETYDRHARSEGFVLRWEFRGVPGAPTRPHLTIAGLVAPGDASVALAMWDRLLATLRPLPHNDVVDPPPYRAAPARTLP